MAIPGIGEIWEGGSSSYTPIASAWEGTANGYKLLWENNPWFFEDDFNRTTIGSNWSSSGALIASGELKKNNSNGSSDSWTVQSFPTDDLQVVTTLGTVGDTQQRSAISLGSPSRYVFCEFAVNGGIIGDYNGSSWTTRATIPSLVLGRGTTIEVRRLGTTIQFLHNGNIAATATSSQGIGSSYRRVNLSVRRDSNIFGTYYSPTFDDVKIGQYRP